MCVVTLGKSPQLFRPPHFLMARADDSGQSKAASMALCFSKHGPRATSTGIPWELVRGVDLGSILDLLDQNLYFNKILGFTVTPKCENWCELQAAYLLKVWLIR